MKKIDLHVHTVATISDSHFDFSIEKMKSYVEEVDLDAIAVTNHNMFDRDQFRVIREELPIKVFPGIEVNLESCHVLIIADESKVDDLEASAQKVEAMITEPTAHITTEELIETFGDLTEYLVIPHYDKKPAIRADTLSKISDYISAGEVDSAKKFVRCAKDESRLVPVLFSDARMGNYLVRMPTRRTYIDCGEITFSAIKACLHSGDKVFLSEKDGNDLFQVLNDDLMISTGLNVLLGDRSSGKTYTLDRISNEQENVKYIRQFSLVQKDEAAYEREFNSEIERRRSRFSDEYLSGFKTVVDDIMNINLENSDRNIGRYIETLLKSAEEADRMDAFSKSTLFGETTFKVGDDKTLKALIGSVRQLIENIDYKEVIERHLDPTALRALACDLIETLWSRALERKKRVYVNGLVKDVRQALGVRSSAIQVEDVDLYRAAIESRKINRFEDIVSHLRSEAEIFNESMQGFKVVAKKGPFRGAGELKATSGKKVSFKGAMASYASPYEYLQKLKEIDAIPDAELYRYFVKIDYGIINSDGFPVSGGERSEFRLLQEISDAQNHDILLIDEPESSFDNMFLKSDVNSLIRGISRFMPVVVVTHNNTVGASVGPDYILFASKEVVGNDVVYKIYRGHPTDKKFQCADGTSMASHHIMMNSLEAGKDAYSQRRVIYEAAKD